MKVKTIIFLVLLFYMPCGAKTITVNDSGTANFDNLQEAIDSAANGDTILVDDGIYKGDGNTDIDFHGKAITLRSKNGATKCIIDCSGSFENLHQGFYFHSGENSYSVVEGFTITNGNAFSGGGIYCKDSHPAVRNCVIRGNTAYNFGGGLYCKSGNPAIENCIFTENSVKNGLGGAIFNLDSAP